VTYYWTQQVKSFKAKEVLGTLIGKGFYREVYDYIPDSRLVIKKIIPREKCLHENKNEFENWSKLREVSVINKLLVPVIDISHCGRFLLMEKTTPLAEFKLENLPKEVPYGYGDGHPNQLSLYKNNIVIHDYGCNLLKPRLMRINPESFWVKKKKGRN